MTKLAFQASIPATLFDDSYDCLHKVAKPMLDSLRQQLRSQNAITGHLRISIMVDDVPPELLPEKRIDIKQAVRKAIAEGTVVEMQGNDSVN